MQELQAARDAGSIPASITLGGRMGDLIDDQGRPEWKWSLSGSWRYQNLTVGAFSQYISSMYDSSLVNSTGDYWTIDSTLTANLYAEYQFDQGVLSDTSIRLGVRNLSDEQPPLSAGGYLGTVYQPYGRYWYVQLPQDLLTLLDGRRLNLRPPFLQSPIGVFHDARLDARPCPGCGAGPVSACLPPPRN